MILLNFLVDVDVDVDVPVHVNVDADRGNAGGSEGLRYALERREERAQIVGTVAV